MLKHSIVGFAIFCCMAHAVASVWNSPYRSEKQQTVSYSAFTTPPKTLDPAKAYSANETLFLAQIYEPPLQYSYLQRPYTLVPLTASHIIVSYYDAAKQKLPANGDPKNVAYTVYDIFLKKGTYFQPHPAFAKDKQNFYVYHHLTKYDLRKVHKLSDFQSQATRELTADDYVYAIKRLANPKTSSPIYGLMSDYILGFAAYGQQLPKEAYVDLRRYPLEGVKTIGRYHYQIRIKGMYPQFLYWLAMPFFAPIPWEGDYFYAQPGMAERNITFDWYPIGTGAYLLAESNPNREITLVKNPHFRNEYYPAQGEPGDQAKGYLLQANQKMPLIDKFVFSLDKESIPRWNKFLQGYYDRSGISADSYDQAIKIDKNGQPIVTPQLREKGIRLQTEVSPSVYYIGFNMLDKVVGGHGEQQRKLRQAIAIALDYEEYIAIFMNGRGIAAQGPIPPGIFGYRQGDINDFIYFMQGGKITRKPLEIAKKLLAQAGYPNGIDPKTQQPLILNYDAAASGNPDDQAYFNWMRKQFAKLGIELNIRSTDYNRFQEKVRHGQAQIFSWGWLADYPDPENFLFLLYGQNSKVPFDGENATNYNNPKVNALFLQIKNMANGEERQKKIDELLRIIREDSPWIWGVHAIDFTLSHQWVAPIKPNAMANNTLKYQKINAPLREKLQREWNQSIIWPLLLLLAAILILFSSVVITYYNRQKSLNVKRFKE